MIRSFKLMMQVVVALLLVSFLGACAVYVEPGSQTTQPIIINPNHDHNNDQNIPPGSYQQSCRNITTSGSTLYAKCRTISGQWVAASMIYKSCKKDIANQDGRLTCMRTDSGAWLVTPPPGSYQQSCQNIKATQDKLYANCRNHNGQWVNTTMKYENCNKDIANSNGKLTCGAVIHVSDNTDSQQNANSNSSSNSSNSDSQQNSNISDNTDSQQNANSNSSSKSDSQQNSNSNNSNNKKSSNKSNLHKFVLGSN